MQLPDINLIHYFMVTAKTLNYSAAARELYISRQALTKNFKRMEEMLGGPLFVQDGGHLALTHLGIDFQQAAFPVMMSWETFSRKINTLCESNQTMLRMAASQGTILSLGGHFTPDFRRENRDILLSIEEALAENVCTMVDLGTVDLALIGSHPAYLSDFVAKPLRLTGIWLLMHESNPLAQKDVLKPVDLKEASFVTPGLHNHLYRYFVEICHDNDVSPNIIGQASYSFDNGLKHADQGIVYFGFSPELITPPEGWCVRRLDVPGSEKFGTYLIKRPGTSATTASQRMMDYIKDRFQIK